MILISDLILFKFSQFILTSKSQMNLIFIYLILYFLVQIYYLIETYIIDLNFN